VIAQFAAGTIASAAEQHHQPSPQHCPVSGPSAPRAPFYRHLSRNAGHSLGAAVVLHRRTWSADSFSAHAPPPTLLRRHTINDSPSVAQSPTTQVAQRTDVHSSSHAVIASLQHQLVAELQSVVQERSLGLSPTCSSSCAHKGAVFNHLPSPNPYADDAEHRLQRAATYPAVNTAAADADLASDVVPPTTQRGGTVGAISARSAREAAELR
jgi:hypothetical protein